jgi:hypothetical protein
MANFFTRWVTIGLWEKAIPWSSTEHHSVSMHCLSSQTWPNSTQCAADFVECNEIETVVCLWSITGLYLQCVTLLPPIIQMQSLLHCPHFSHLLMRNTKPGIKRQPVYQIIRFLLNLRIHVPNYSVTLQKTDKTITLRSGASSFK